MTIKPPANTMTSASSLNEGDNHTSSAKRQTAGAAEIQRTSATTSAPSGAEDYKSASGGDVGDSVSSDKAVGEKVDLKGKAVSLGGNDGIDKSAGAAVKGADGSIPGGGSSTQGAPEASTSTIINNLGGPQTSPGASSGLASQAPLTNTMANTDIVVHDTVVVYRDTATNNLLPQENQTLTQQSTWNQPLDDLINYVSSQDNPRGILENMQTHASSEVIQRSNAESQTAQNTVQSTSPSVASSIPAHSALANALNSATATAQYDAATQTWALLTSKGTSFFNLDGTLLEEMAQNRLATPDSLASTSTAASLLAGHPADTTRPKDAEAASMTIVLSSTTETTELKRPDGTTQLFVPKESDAGRLLNNADSSVRANDPNSFFRDQESGKLLLRNPSGTWQVFDKSGRFVSDWRPHAGRKQGFKVTGKNNVSGREQQSCALWGECQREGLPSCCEYQGSF